MDGVESVPEVQQAEDAFLVVDEDACSSVNRFGATRSTKGYIREGTLKYICIGRYNKTTKFIFETLLIVLSI